MEKGENLRKKLVKIFSLRISGQNQSLCDFILLRYYAVSRISIKNFDKGGRGFRGENKIHGKKKFMIFSPEKKNQKGHKKIYIMIYYG